MNDLLLQPIGAKVLIGVGVSPGVAVGQVVQSSHGEIVVREVGGDYRAERRRLERAIERAKLQLEALQARLRAEADPAKAAIFSAHAELLDDPELLDRVHARMTGGKSAAYAWQREITDQADRLASSRSELLATRADDVRDVGRRVLRLITGSATSLPRYPPNTILIAADLTPSETANLDRSMVLGFCTVTGGSTSHVSILARSLGIPAIAGIDPRAVDIADGVPVVVDGGRGTLLVRPTLDQVAGIREAQRQYATRRHAAQALASLDARTRDGRRVEVAANVDTMADVDRAAATGAEGVGLLRSEFLFIGRNVGPSEDEQAAIYETIARRLGTERALTIRLLDVGGEKPLPYVTIGSEQNPSLGERGTGLMLDRPELMVPQIRAILRAGFCGSVRAMLPMVRTLDEWHGVKAIFEDERRRIGAPSIPLGIMVEVPSVAILAERFASEVDFFSIGTNDLTQFTLATDRDHPKLASHVDALHPAILQLISSTVQAARRHGKRVTVCGGLADDDQGIAVLVGLGVDGLSVPLSSLPAVKARIREMTYPECESLAARALEATSAADVRRLVAAQDTLIEGSRSL